MTWSKAEPGTYILWAEIEIKGGNIVQSDSITIDVISP
jgi:hypothetical protein